MLQALSTSELHQQQSRDIESFQPEAPWILLRDRHTRVNYEFTTTGDLFDEQDADIIALSFHCPRPLEPGTEINIAVPLPDSMRGYSADVVYCMDGIDSYEVGLHVKIESDMDLLTIMRSNAYLSSGYNI